MKPTAIVFETHSISEDNERGCATGWNHGALSTRGRELAVELGRRRREDGLDVVLVSDLRRAAETAEIAFAGSPVPVLHDWRLRECDYGDLNGQPTDLVRAAVSDVNDHYPGGESWADAVERVRGVIDDIGRRWPGRRVLIIGHMSAYWALEHHLDHLPLESIGAPFDWQEGWEYQLLDEVEIEVEPNR
jgi:broad specificity phosphatase PhoE